MKNTTLPVAPTGDLLFDLAPACSGFVTESELREMLPHGSGIDCDWRFEPMKDGIRCRNSFHFMDENGYYSGWGDFSVVLFHHKADVFNPLRGPCAGKTQVVHRRGDVDFKIVTHGSAWRRVAADGLADYIHESVYFSLEKILTKRHETIATLSAEAKQ